MDLIQSLQDELCTKLKNLGLNLDESLQQNSGTGQKTNVCKSKTEATNDWKCSCGVIIKPNPWKKENIDMKFHKSSHILTELLRKQSLATHIKSHHIKLVDIVGDFIHVNLARPYLQSQVFASILKRKELFGFENQYPSQLFIISVYQNSTEIVSSAKDANHQSMHHFRRDLYANCLQRIFVSYGMSASISKEICDGNRLINPQQSNMAYLSIFKVTADDQSCKESIKDADTVSDLDGRTDPCACNFQSQCQSNPICNNTGTCLQKGLTVDVLSFCKDHGIELGNAGYDKNIKYVEVRNDAGEPTKQTMTAIKLKELLNIPTHSKQYQSILHLCYADELFSLQQSVLLMQVLTESSPVEQMFAVFHSPKKEEKGQKEAFETYLRRRTEEIFSSYKVKYGPAVKGKDWEETIRDVAYSSLVFELLSYPAHKQIRLDLIGKVCGEEEDSLSRDSTFVLYNYARLSMLMRHFEAEVKQGTYPALPPVEEVDFSLLREQMEWHLFLYYVLFYPMLLESVVSSIFPDKGVTVYPAVNKICSFLLRLSHDLSSYYHQTKVLLEPRQHLYPLMHARLFLMLAIKQIMSNAFSLLGINPPSQM